MRVCVRNEVVTRIRRCFCAERAPNLNIYLQRPVQAKGYIMRNAGGQNSRDSV